MYNVKTQKLKATSQKVLIITYYWPPAGGPGVQRWLKFVKYLPEFGIEPIVYIPENPTYPLVDESLNSEIPDGITMLKQPILEPYAIAGFFSRKSTKTISSGIIAAPKTQTFLQKLLLYIRGNFFVPDARKFWVKPSVKYLKNYIATHQIDTIITTGPPHSLHLIGMQLQKALDIRWFADFRDPWTTIGYHRKLKLGKKAQQRHKKLEKQVLNHADTVLVTSFTTKKEFEALTKKPIHVITNGFDTETVAPIVLDKAFSISHIGSLLSGRDPKNLWKALANLTKEYSAFAESLQINLTGAVSDDVLQSIKSFGLDPYLSAQGYVSHEIALQLQRQAQVLLLIEIDSPDTRCIIPGKLFEYMNAQRPIVAVGPKGGDVAQLLQDTGSGNYFDYEEYDGIKAQLLTHFHAYQNTSLTVQGSGIDRYSRKSLTGELAQLLSK